MSINKKKTDELHKALESMSLKDYGTYISENDILPVPSVSSFFEDYIKEHGLTRKELVKNSQLDRTYAYQILSGLRKPSRDKLLALCLSGEMSFAEIQRVLEIGQAGVLYDVFRVRVTADMRFHPSLHPGYIGGKQGLKVIHSLSPFRLHENRFSLL